MQSFGIALAFLTCLHLPRGYSGICNAASIAASVPWYPVVGLLLGLLCTAPLHLLATFSTASELSWLWAWAYVLGHFFLTRGLHWDGLADIADAWGSGAQGPRFWEIVKDSRLGAFGSMGQILAFSGLLIVCQAHIQQGQWWPLVLAPGIGRAACIFLAASTLPRDPHSLGGMACAGASLRCAGLWGGGLALCLLLVLHKPAVLLLLVCLLAGLFVFLRRMTRQQGGCNGDFLGSTIVLSEFLALTACLF